MRAIHFVPPHIIVELDATIGKKYDKKSLPARAGGLSIQYHEAHESFWNNSSQAGHERLIIVEEIRAGDRFDIDGYSKGRLDMCATGRSFIKPDMPHGIYATPIECEDWKVETAFLVFGAIG